MNKNYNNLMIDMETMGEAMVSIGAVFFNFEDDIDSYDLENYASCEDDKYPFLNKSNAFYSNISLESSVELGLEMDPSTVMFWMKQDKEAINSLFINPKHINDVLVFLKQFIDLNCNDINNLQVWAKSPSYDCERLKKAFELRGYRNVWNFRKERDVRTALAIDPDLKPTKAKIKHHALHDCIAQIKDLKKVTEKYNLNYV